MATIHSATIIDGQFLVPGAKGSTLFVPTDDAFDESALALGRLSQGLLPWLILPRRDHRFYVVLSQPAPNVWLAVTLVPRQFGWPVGDSPTATQQDPTQQGLEGRRLMPLTGSNINAHDDAAIGHQQRHLGAETATGVSQRMFSWFLELRRRRPL